MVGGVWIRSICGWFEVEEVEGNQCVYQEVRVGLLGIGLEWKGRGDMGNLGVEVVE